MAATQANITIPAAAWTNLVAVNAALASADVVIQNLSANLPVLIVFGGAQPVDRRGSVLRSYDTVAGSAAAIWVRCDSAAELAVTLVND